jgi:hypothetical protein
MRKFSWRTMIIFIMLLLLGVVLVGLGTAYVSKLKQQRRQLSDNFPFRAPMGGGACASVASTLAAILLYPTTAVRQLVEQIQLGKSFTVRIL